MIKGMSYRCKCDEDNTKFKEVGTVYINPYNVCFVREDTTNSDYFFVSFINGEGFHISKETAKFLVNGMKIEHTLE